MVIKPDESRPPQAGRLLRTDPILERTADRLVRKVAATKAVCGTTTRGSVDATAPRLFSPVGLVKCLAHSSLHAPTGQDRAA